MSQGKHVEAWLDELYGSTRVSVSEVAADTKPPDPCAIYGCSQVHSHVAKWQMHTTVALNRQAGTEIAGYPRNWLWLVEGS